MQEQADGYALGKRLFLDKVNQSDAKNMHPVLAEAEGGKDLYFRRVKETYYDKHDIEYQPPPVVKDILKKSTFVHNCIANKNKINVEHFDSIYNKKVFTPKMQGLLQRLHNANVDFRSITQFKNALFDSEELKDNHLLPMSEWDSLRQYFMPKLQGSQEADILEYVRHGPDMVNLMKFTDIVDLFFYLPMTKYILKNQSPEIF